MTMAADRDLRIGAGGALAKQQHTLESAVRAELAAGVRDPVEIVARLSEKHGQTWLLRQLVNVVARIVAGSPAVRAASAIRATPRRRSPVAAREPAREPVKAVPGRTRVEKAAADAAGDFFSGARWVSPEVGWKPVLDLTAEDCRTIAAQLKALSDVAARHRAWFEDAAAAIEQEGAATLREVKRQLIAPVGVLPAGAATL